MSWNSIFSHRRMARGALVLVLSLLVTSMNGCDGLSWNEANLALQAREKGEIRVLTLRHPLVDDSQGRIRKGLERDLLQNFADTYGLRIRFIQKTDSEQLFAALAAGEGQVVAARLWNRDSRAPATLQGPSFEESHLSLFCHRQLKVQHIKDLGGLRVALLTKDNLSGIDQRLRFMVPNIRLRLENQNRLRPLFSRISARQLDCLFAENIDGQLHARAWPLIEKMETPMTEKRGLNWVVRADRPDLVSLMNAWFQRASRHDEIMRIQDHTHANLSEIEVMDARQFLANLRSRFPEYRSLFLVSAKEHHLDWKLLGAVAYQESHWNPEARSYTGVRGMMQLTADTAEAVGIEDRTDPAQSIWGGAFYLRFLLNRMPTDIDASERMALALAAYNAGQAHLQDAQLLAVRKGLNPLSWRHLKMVFPLLEDPAIAATVPYGYSRGRETVRFVERVRGFHSLWKMVD